MKQETHLQLRHTGNIITLAVQVVRVERLDSLEHLLVVVVHQLVVRAAAVPRVEGVVADHGEGLGGQGGLALDDVVEVLVVAPGEHDVVEAAAGAVDAELGAVDLVAVVRVVLEGLGAVDDTVVKGAADGEGVTDNVPLAFGGEEIQQLAQVVDQARQLHPARLTVTTDGLGGLEQMLDLREGGVRVGLVDERVELLHRLPHRHLGVSLGAIVVAGLEIVGDRLLGVLLLVEVLDPIAGVLELSELSLVLVLIKLGLLVQAFLFQVVLEDVDIVDGVGDVLEGLAITLGVEAAEGLSDGGGCHFGV